MTSRERLLALINKEQIDRVPISPFIQQEFMSDYLKKADTHRVIDAKVCAEELGIDLMTREYMSKPYFLKKSFPNWEVDEKSVIENDNFYRITTITTPEKTFRQVEGAPYKKDILAGIHFVTTEFMISNKQDFEIFSKYMPKMDDDHRKYIIESGAFAKKHIEQVGINAPWCMGGVFNLVCTFVNIQNMLMDAMIDNEYYDTYMSFFADLLCEDVKCFIDSDYDIIGMQGNMANGGLMRGDHFEKYVLPYEKKANCYC